MNDAIEDEGLCSIGKKCPLCLYWSRDNYSVHRLRVQLKSGGKNDMNENVMRTHQNSLSVLLAPELSIPKLFQGVNYMLKVILCTWNQSCTMVLIVDDIETM